MSTNFRGRDSYGDDEPSKPRQTDEAKLAPTPVPAPAIATALPSAPFKDNSVSAVAHAQEATLSSTVSQKAIDPRAPPQPAVNQQPVKVENNPYAIEEEADNYTGWDAAVSGANGGAGGNDNGGYGGYGYDASGGAGAYGDGNASGSPAIKEDGCVFILNFSYYIVCTAKIFYEARGDIGRLGLVSRSYRRGFSGKTKDWFSKDFEKVGLKRRRGRGRDIKKERKFIHPASTTLLTRVITISTAANISIEDLGGQESILLCHLPTATTTPTSIRELASRTALRYTKDSLCARKDNGNQRLDWTPYCSIIYIDKKKRESFDTSTSEANSPSFVWPRCHRSAVITTDWAFSRFMGDFSVCIFAFFFSRCNKRE